MTPFVSVLMSLYNDGLFVSEAVRSILTQTFADFEFIIVDDGCVDDSISQIEKIQDARIRLIRQPHRGLAGALNLGIQAAVGVYIARQDGDDISAPDRLEKEVALFETRSGLGLAGCNATLIDQDGMSLTETDLPIRDDHIQQALLNEVAGNPFIHGAVMFRRDCVLQAGLYRTEFRQAQDLDLWLRIAEKYEIANLQDAGYFWRLRRGAVGEKNLQDQRDYSRLARLCAHRRRAGESEPALALESVRRGHSGWLFSRLRRANLAVEYEMKVGIILFDTGRMRDARSKLVHVVSRSPFYLYAWLLLVLSIFPHHLAIRLRLWSQNLYHAWMRND